MPSKAPRSTGAQIGCASHPCKHDALHYVTPPGYPGDAATNARALEHEQFLAFFAGAPRRDNIMEICTGTALHRAA